MATNTVDAMLAEARRQGWLVGNSLGFIPELMNIYASASREFTKLVDELSEKEPHMRETWVYETYRYLFAKGVEGVILWGNSNDGKVSVLFHPRHLGGDMEVEVPHHLKSTVIESVKIGESLFRAHQKWVLDHQAEESFDLETEIRDSIQWAPRFGIHYGLHNKYMALR